MELNAEQLIKALECCNTGTIEDCAECPRFDDDRTLSTADCMERLMRDAIALIKQLTEENERLKEILHTDIPYVCVSRGSGKTNHLREVARLRMDAVRAYAVREMQTEINKTLSVLCKGDVSEIRRMIDQIAKEMTDGK